MMNSIWDPRTCGSARHYPFFSSEITPEREAHQNLAEMLPKHIRRSESNVSRSDCDEHGIAPPSFAFKRRLVPGF